MPNPAFWAVLVGALAILALILALPVLRRVFQFSPLHLDDLAISAGLTLALVLALVGAGRLGTAQSRRLA